MSAPAKTSERQICHAVRHLLETAGDDTISMEAIAEEVGIRAPSLYKRFAGKADLLSAAASDALAELAESLQDAVEIAKPYESLERMAHLYRKFAKKNPRTYALIFSKALAPREDLLSARQRAAEPQLAVLTRELGRESAANASVMLASFLHGFLSMELAKTFRFGGNVNDAFHYGLTKQLDGLFAGRRLRAGGNSET